MNDIGVDDCPMPEPFGEKIGITVFLAWLFFLGFVTRALFSPLMPAVVSDLEISHSQAGSLFLFITIGYLFAPIFSGLISSRINHLGTLRVSAWVIGFALLPFAFVQGLWPIRLLLIVIGLAAGIHLPSAIATITAEVQKSDWGKALSVHQCAPPLSLVSAPIVAAVLLNWFSWRYVLVLWGTLALVSALLYACKGRGGEFPGQIPSPEKVKQVVGKPSFWIMVILFSMAMGANAGIYAMLPLFFVNERGFDLASANTLIGLSQIPGVVMVFIGGWIADKLGQKTTMVSALLATAILTMLLGWVQDTLLIIVLFLQPAVLASFFPSAFAALSRIAPPSMRSVTNALGPPLAFLLGGGVLPAAIGYMGETTSFSMGIVSAGCVMAVGPFLVYFLKLGQYDDQSGC